MLLLPTEFSDSDKIKALSGFTGCQPKYNSYAHFRVSHHSSTFNTIKQFSYKCLKYPKKCGFQALPTKKFSITSEVLKFLFYSEDLSFRRESLLSIKKQIYGF